VVESTADTSRADVLRGGALTSLDPDVNANVNCQSITYLYSAESYSISTALNVLSNGRRSSCLKLLLLRAGSRRLTGREFQTVGPAGPATEKARRLKVARRNEVYPVVKVVL